MSFENKNLYDLLGNDVEDESTPNLPIREVVKNTSSSKKKDVPPTSADPSKAKKKTKPTGNEGALKTKANNKEVPGPSSTPSKHYKKPFDRHSRSQKTDSDKKIRQGWGGDDKRELEDEVEGLEDANEDLAAEAGADTDATSATPKRSLQDYFAELKLQQEQLGSTKELRKANEGSEDKWADAELIKKEQASYIESSNAKKAKQKTQKEKKFLEIDATFADNQTPFRNESARGNFKRGGRRGANQSGQRGGAQSGRRGGAQSGKRGGKESASVAVDDKNFPSL